MHIKQEKRIVKWMIVLYCRKKHKSATRCPDCQKLLEYAEKKLNTCRYGENKTACKKCPTHCYAPAYREKIRAVMRFSGPRMILYHPVAMLRYCFQKQTITSQKQTDLKPNKK
ncbi:MAG: nitrous oxide-stimulated promoter family protein [Tannerellaceae bacterium]|jgi:hypothetical protein|nr:nitrous oxide-stimulated promoter family protein [Tannerellaceae bacterium]